MPLLSGLATVDASGNALQDASTNYIQEQSLQVVVDYTTGVVMLWPWVAPMLESIAAAIAEAITTKLLGGGADVDLNAVATNAYNAATLASATLDEAEATHGAVDGVADSLSTHDANLATFAVGAALQLEQIHTHVETIEGQGGGGLTEEEHGKLMSVPDTSQIAGDVWGYSLPTYYLNGNEWGAATGTYLQAIGDYLQLEQGMYGRRLPGNPYFAVCFVDIERGNGWQGNWASEAYSALVPELDMSLVQSGDTLISYLQREYGSYAWGYTGPTGTNADGPVWLIFTSGTSYARCLLTDADIQAAWPVSTEVVEVTTQEVTVQDVTVETQVVEFTADVPPVWPGLAGVTVGDPVALSDGLDLTGPFDGLIIAVTGAPARAGRYHFGAVNSWQHVGAVTFYNDRGEYERAESFGMDTQIIVPRTMKQAAGCIVRLNTGWTGTVRAWTKT